MKEINQGASVEMGNKAASAYEAARSAGLVTHPWWAVSEPPGEGQGGTTATAAINRRR